jgi:hypothetical protein
MVNRIVAGPLWFLAVLATYELFVSLADWPRLVGPLIALVAATFVVTDPFGLFWIRRTAAGAGSPPAGHLETAHRPA